MSMPFEKVFIGIYQTLKADATFLTKVPKVNIRPYTDTREPIAGGLITYAWSGSFWDTHRRRGEGTLLVICEHPDNMLAAGEIMDLFRQLCDEDTISGYGTDVHSLREKPEFADTLPPKLNRYSVTTGFDVKITEGTVDKTATV